MKKEIVLIGTGGTIAGKASSNSDLTGYVSGALQMEEVLAAVPGLDVYGPYRDIQFSNIDSSDMTVSHWMKLSKLIQSELEKESVAGVVIMHGTDTMEETSYFLNLTVHTNKPIVMVGAMRPATALGADGPVNLLQAVQVCREREEALEKFGEEANYGVLVVMNGRIHNSRIMTKRYTTNVDSFGSLTGGTLGAVQDGYVYWHQRPYHLHTNKTPFKLDNLKDLPRVEILYPYVGISKDIVDVYMNDEIKGLVVAGMGHGTISAPIREALKNNKAVTVKASRTWNGAVSSIPTDRELDLISSGTLTPLKARILLMLALTVTDDLVEIQEMFDKY